MGSRVLPILYMIWVEHESMHLVNEPHITPFVKSDSSKSKRKTKNTWLYTDIIRAFAMGRQQWYRR